MYIEMHNIHRFSARTRTALRPKFLLTVTLLLIGCTQAKLIEVTPQTSASTNSVQSSTGERFDAYNIVTVLPRDAISAIDNPKFVSAEEADESYADDELVMGVAFNGEARAYSIPTLSSHEIVNDTVGGVKIVVTW